MSGAASVVGQRLEYTGTSGTQTVAAGATITTMMVHSSVGGTMVTPAGNTLTIPAGTWFVYQPFHSIWTTSNNALTSGSQNFVFTGTDSYFIEAVGPNNAV